MYVLLCSITTSHLESSLLSSCTRCAYIPWLSRRRLIGWTQYRLLEHLAWCFILKTITFFFSNNNLLLRNGSISSNYAQSTNSTYQPLERTLSNTIPARGCVLGCSFSKIHRQMHRLTLWDARAFLLIATKRINTHINFTAVWHPVSCRGVNSTATCRAWSVFFTTVCPGL